MISPFNLACYVTDFLLVALRTSAKFEAVTACYGGVV